MALKPALNLGAATAAVPSTKEPRSYTVRELIRELANCSDMDAEVTLSVFNMDPTPVASVDEGDDNQVVIGNV